MSSIIMVDFVSIKLRGMLKNVFFFKLKTPWGMDIGQLMVMELYYSYINKLNGFFSSL